MGQLDRRVENDEVERSWNITIEIAIDDLHPRHTIEHRVDTAEAQWLH